MAEKTLIVITGPTASGKSDLAVEVARRLGTEIVSADSRQIYRGIPIVTASPTAEQLAAVPHHLVGVLGLEEYYSASCFEQDALRILDGIFSRSDYAVACGGSMMYIDALCHGIDALPTVPDDIRQGLKSELDARGPEWLLGELRRLDPAYYAEVDRKNLKRVFHAVEICLAAGAPYSSLRTGRKAERPFRVLKFGLSLPREQLFARINARVDKMVEAGLEAEARRVYELRHLNSLNTVGLKEMFQYFDGEMDFATAVARIGKNTRVYAKKQLTWFRRDALIRWLDADADPLGVILSVLPPR